MLIIDRFEGDVAVCEDEDRRIVEMDRSLLPEGAREGSVLISARHGGRSRPQRAYQTAAG